MERPKRGQFHLSSERFFTFILQFSVSLALKGTSPTYA